MVAEERENRDDYPPFPQYRRANKTCGCQHALLHQASPPQAPPPPVLREGVYSLRVSVVVANIHQVVLN